MPNGDPVFLQKLHLGGMGQRKRRAGGHAGARAAGTIKSAAGKVVDLHTRALRIWRSCHLGRAQEDPSGGGGQRLRTHQDLKARLPGRHKRVLPILEQPSSVLADHVDDRHGCAMAQRRDQSGGRRRRPVPPANGLVDQRGGPTGGVRLLKPPLLADEVMRIGPAAGHRLGRRCAFGQL